MADAHTRLKQLALNRRADRAGIANLVKMGAGTLSTHHHPIPTTILPTLATAMPRAAAE